MVVTIMSEKPSGWSTLLNTLQVRKDFSQKPAGLKWRSNTLFIIATVAMGLFTDLFLYGLIIPVLPFLLHDRVGLPKDQIQGQVSNLLSVYAGASVLCSPFAGWFADRMPSRQIPFLFGLGALFMSTILLFVGETIPVLTLARALQGISGGFVWTIGLALCLETVGPGDLGKTIGSIFSIISVGNFAAPILGGVLYEKTGYIGVFALGSSILVLDLFMRLLIIDKKTARRYERSGCTSDTCAIHNNTPVDTSSEPTTPTIDETVGERQPLLGGIKEDDSYYKLDGVRSSFLRAVPILPCLRDPKLLTALLAVLVQAMLFGCFDATIPTVADEYFNFASLQAGLLFIPLCALNLIVGPVFGWCVDHYGTKPVSVLGYAFLIPVMICLRIPHAGGTQQIVIYSILLACSGIGLAAIGAPSLVECGAVVQRYHDANPTFFGPNGPYAQLYGLNNMVFSSGLTLGPILAGTLKQKIGYGNMNLVMATICLLPLILCFAYMGGKPRILCSSRTSSFSTSQLKINDDDAEDSC